MNRICEPHEIDIASRPIGLSPGAAAILETLTAERNDAGFIGVPVLRLAALAHCAPEHVHAFITELQLHELVTVRARTGEVIMFELHPTRRLRVARRRP